MYRDDGDAIWDKGEVVFVGSSVVVVTDGVNRGVLEGEESKRQLDEREWGVGGLYKKRKKMMRKRHKGDDVEETSIIQQEKKMRKTHRGDDVKETSIIQQEKKMRKAHKGDEAVIQQE